MSNDDHSDVPGTLALALALWAAAVTAGTHAGAFAKLAPGAFAALAVFATAFATGVVLLDARVRDWLGRHAAMGEGFAAVGVAVLAVALGAGLAREGPVEPAAAPWAPIVLFVLPVTVAAVVATALAIRRERRSRGEARLTSGAWRVPAGHRAAP